jgi:outer membrane protein assembly factor BamB
MSPTWLPAVAALVLVGGVALADNWPGWRGPTGDGRTAETELPLNWSATENVRWKAPLPDVGNSSPVVWKDRVFLTQSQDKGARRAVLCFDRANGRLLWQREVRFDGQEPTHATNPHCSATPATDGQRVVVSHGSAGLFCYDFAGQELWHTDVGKLEHIWGNASSPVLHGDLVFAWCGPGERQFLLALDKRTGKEVWKHDEPGGNAGKDQSEWRGSWSTPVIVKAEQTRRPLRAPARR